MTHLVIATETGYAKMHPKHGIISGGLFPDAAKFPDSSEGLTRASADARSLLDKVNKVTVYRVDGAHKFPVTTLSRPGLSINKTTHVIPR